jgi:DNA-binding MarR family transcriptional regulator
MMDAGAEGALVERSDELRTAVGRVARRLRQLYADDDVAFSETSLLSRLDRHGTATPSALAAQEQVRPQAINATLRALEQRGLVERHPDATDRRKVLIAVTDSGRRSLADQGRAVSRRVADALEGEFTVDERRRLLTVAPLLERLAGAL